MYSLNAQDKLVLRNGRTVEVKVLRSIENRVEYTYPGETSVYERPKTAISYILYQDGRREIFDENLRESERGSSSNRTTTSQGTNRTTTNRTTQPSSSRNILSGDDEIFWQDVKTTFNESEVKGLTRLKRVTAVSRATYKDAIQQLKQRAAEMGGTTVLVMDIPESDGGEQIEIMGIAYREEGMAYTPRSTSERNAPITESASNERRRRIAQQMDGYNNDIDNSSRNTRTSPSSTSSSSSRTNARPATDAGDNAPDAIYLLNGRVVRGFIEEFEPDDFVSIRTTNGRINEYSMDDVKRVSRGSSRATARQSQSRSSSRYDDGGRSQARNTRDYDDYPISGYKGTFDAGYNFAMGGTGEKGSFEFNTSHGYQINEFLFIGAGVGLHMFNARDLQLKTNINSADKFPQYVSKTGLNAINDSVTYMRAVDSSFMTLPIFLDIRGYLPMENSAIVPFAMLRVGYSFNLSDGFGGMGLYMNPAVGVKYQISPMIGINFSIGYSYQSYGGIPLPKDGSKGGYGYYYIKDATKTKYEAKGAGGISLKLGVEF